MNWDFNSTLKLDNEFDILENAQNYLYIDYRNVTWFRTNETGKEIISRCNGTISLDEVIAEMALKYGFSTQFLKTNFKHFIDEAVNKGVLFLPGEEKKYLPVVAPEYPQDIWVHVTDQCNLHCPFCYSSSGMDGTRELDYKAVLKLLEEIPEENRLTVIISGGEPFLYKNLLELTLALNELKFKNIVVITNGTVGEEMYPKVIPNIHTLQVSVDGTNAEFHDRTRGQGSFEKMCKKLALARELGIKRLLISFTPTKYNIENLPLIPQFVLDHKINAIHITRLMPVGRGMVSIKTIVPGLDLYSGMMKEFLRNIQKINKLIHFKRETEEFFAEPKDKTPYIEVTIAADQSQKILSRFKKANCSLGCGTLSFNYDGYLYPCPSLHREDFRLGNIAEGNLKAILVNAKSAGNQYSVDNTPECSSCEIRYFCGGGCRAVALACSGDIHGEDPMCSYYKESIYEIMWKFQDYERNRAD